MSAIPITERVDLLLRRAGDCATRSKAKLVLPEHLLFALMMDGKLISSFWPNLQIAEMELVDKLGFQSWDEGESLHETVPANSRELADVLRMASEEATESNLSFLDSVSLLLALAMTRGTSDVLAEMGVTLDRIRERAAEVLGRPLSR